MNRFMMMAMAAAMLDCSVASSFAASFFTGLGFLPEGTGCEAKALSSDGKVVVGTGGRARAPMSHQAFRWTADRGIIPLGILSTYSCNSTANGVSDDGSVVVGTSSTSNRRVDHEAFRWTAADGMVGLGRPLGESSVSNALAVSGDGSVVVGDCSSSLGRQAFRWTADSGMVALGCMPGYSCIRISAISKDASVIVGTCESAQATDKVAFRWTAKGGIASLGFLPNRPHDNRSATAVSGDGKVVVGNSNNQVFRWTVEDGMTALLPNGTTCFAGPISSDGKVITGISYTRATGYEAFRWTADTGKVPLGRLPGCACHFIEALSADGGVLVGFYESSAIDEVFRWDNAKGAFIWDKVNGLRDLQTALITEYQLDLNGWKLVKAHLISADGKTIVGVGKHNDRKEIWIARLDRPLNAPAGKKQEK